MSGKNDTKRLMYLDYLRVLATIFVIVNHVANGGMECATSSGEGWNIFNAFASCSRWPIGIFVMISGILFLGRDISVEKLFSKYVLRIAVAYFVWKILYAIYAMQPLDVSLKIFMTGPYHLWYLPMIAGIYICTPIFRLIAKDEKITKYYLVLAFVFAFVIPEIKVISDVYMGGALKDWTFFISNTGIDMYMDLVCGYGFYYLAGYYLNNRDISLREELVIYVLGVIGCVSTIFLNGIARTDVFYGSFNVNVCLEVLSLFVLFKCRLKEVEIINKVVSWLGATSFGVYLVHVMVISALGEYFGIYPGSFSPVVAQILLTGGVYVFATIISYVLGKIPFVNKYLV